MAASYICLYINIHCASHRTITSLGNQPNMKVVVNIPWKSVFLSLSLRMEGQVLQNFWGAKSHHWKFHTELSLYQQEQRIWYFFSSPPCHPLLYLHKISCREWREKYICQNNLILSLNMSLTEGCILGTRWKDAVPRGFQSVFPVFPQMISQLSYSDQRPTGVLWCRC